MLLDNHNVKYKQIRYFFSELSTEKLNICSSVHQLDISDFVKSIS